MNWIRVARPRVQPREGTYAVWKAEILEACGGRCIYCCISEGEYGGMDNFHVEHFRPKSRFAGLENAIDNLFAACAICNRFKSDEWPGEPDAAGQTATFLDPSEVDYNEHMELAGNTVSLTGTTVAGRFMIERIYLNRPQLLLSRRLRIVLERLKVVNLSLAAELEALAGTGIEGHSVVQRIAAASLTISSLQAKIATARQYGADDTKRQRKTGSPEATLRQVRTKRPVRG